VEHFSLKVAVVLGSTLVAVWLGIQVWKSRDPVILKVILTGILFVPLMGPLIVYWISNFPSRLHPDVQARNPKQINSYGRWRTEDDEPKTREKR
jgi:hypothetical protein